VTHAIVLIEAERAAIRTLGGALADVEGVAEAYSVTGEWDFVAILRVRNPEEVAEVVTGRLADLDGIKRTHTLVAFEVFSQHVLDRRLVLPAAGEPGRAVLPVVRHEQDARGGQEDAGRAVVPALTLDPQSPEVTVVVQHMCVMPQNAGVHTSR
jgi:uncharacterized protein with GYD domain